MIQLNPNAVMRYLSTSQSKKEEENTGWEEDDVEIDFASKDQSKSDKQLAKSGQSARETID